MTDSLRYPQIASKVLNTPLLIEQSKLNTILEVLGPRMGFDVPQASGEPLKYTEPDAHMLAMQQMRASYNEAGFWVVDGTAIIPVLGTLVQRASGMDALSGLQSYQDVSQMFTSAMNDYSVRDILLEVDTPGGEVAGAFDLADGIYQARGNKPITAVASELASSAGYLIASAADEVVLPRTGMVGSIGVVAAHFDYSKQLEKRGVAVTFIYAGDHKIDGNKFQPLPPGVKADMQAQIDELYQLFVDTVSRNRSMGADRVRGTQAGMFMGFKAVDAGLADRVNTLGNELNNSAIRRQGMTNRIQTEKESIDMSTQAQNPAGSQAPQPTPPAQPAPANPAAPPAPAPQPDPKLAAQSERERIRAIKSHPEAVGRESYAEHLALDTDYTAEQCFALLTHAPKAAASAPAPKQNRLDVAMQGRQPGIQSQELTEHHESAVVIDANEVYARRAAEAAKFRTVN